jgi:hypothetical protein
MSMERLVGTGFSEAAGPRTPGLAVFNARHGTGSATMSLQCTS